MAFLQVKLHLVCSAPVGDAVGGLLNKLAVPGCLAQVGENLVGVLDELNACRDVLVDVGDED